MFYNLATFVVHAISFTCCGRVTLSTTRTSRSVITVSLPRPLEIVEVPGEGRRRRYAGGHRALQGARVRPRLVIIGSSDPPFRALAPTTRRMLVAGRSLRLSRTRTMQASDANPSSLLMRRSCRRRADRCQNSSRLKMNRTTTLSVLARCSVSYVPSRVKSRSILMTLWACDRCAASTPFAFRPSSP